MRVGIRSMGSVRLKVTTEPLGTSAISGCCIIRCTVMTPAPGEAAVVRRSDGTFVIDMVADGVRLPFVFDTGASTVVLRAQDAQRIGIDSRHLAFNQEVSTANGRTRAAEANIESLSAGSITLNNMQALVAAPGALNENLLGQTFLERLASYGVEGNRLVLRSK